MPLWPCSRQRRRPVLYIDDRAGSKELAEPLAKRGLPTDLTRLDFGDVAFQGRGEGDRPVWVGLEFKQLAEFIQAVRSERFQGYQLPGMRETYAVSYLLIEGRLEFSDRGELTRKVRGGQEKLHGRMSVSELLKRLFVLHLRGGVNPLMTNTRRDTLATIEALYRVWTDVPLDQHTSHIGMYQAPALVPISDFRQAVCKWPGIGVRTSRSVEQAFVNAYTGKPSLELAVLANVDQWAAIEITSESGRKRRLGHKQAQEIVQFLRGQA